MTGIKLLLATGCCASWAVFAQAAEPSSESLVKTLISTLGPMGFMAWYCWYSTAKTLPDKDAQITDARREYLEAADRERASHAKLVNDVLADNRQQRDATLAVMRGCPHTAPLGDG